MSFGKLKMVIFLLVFLLVLAVVCYLLMDLNAENEARKAEELAAPTPTVDPYVDPYIETPPPQTTSVFPDQPSAGTSEQPVAVPTPEPTPTPTPTPEPTVAAMPAGTVIGSGSFESDTGVPLNLRASWTATVEDASNVRVDVQIDLISYSLQIMESYNAVNVAVGDSYKSANTPSVDYDGAEQISTTLAKTSHTLHLSPGETQSFPVAVEYTFNGVYFKREIYTIECGGHITLSR